MEEEGVTIDTEALAEMGIEIGEKMAAVEGKYGMAGEEFNLNSPNSWPLSFLKSCSCR